MPVEPTCALRTGRGLVRREVVEHYLHGLGIRVMDFDQFTRAVGTLWAVLRSVTFTCRYG